MLHRTAFALSLAAVLTVRGNTPSASFAPFEIFDARRNAIARGGDMLEARAGHTATPLPDGGGVAVCPLRACARIWRYTGVRASRPHPPGVSPGGMALNERSGEDARPVRAETPALR